MLRMSVSVEESLVEEASKVLGTTSKSETIRAALSEVVRQERIAQVLSHQGRIALDLDQEGLARLREAD